jgi:hypothetical protein
MRAARVIVMLWLLWLLAMWIREGRDFCVLETLPFVERQQTLSHDYESLALAAVLIGLWGCLMLAHRQNSQRREIQEPQEAQEPPKSEKLPNPQQSSPPRPEFRSSVLLVPTTIITLALITPRLKLAASFADTVGRSPKVMEHTYLALLCVAVFAAVLVIKWMLRR